MELVLIVIGLGCVFAILLCVGRPDKPVREWSDQKLARLAPKYQRQHTNLFLAGKYDQAMPYVEKAREIETEIASRTMALEVAAELAAILASIPEGQRNNEQAVRAATKAWEKKKRRLKNA
jgi:hypothetical protein